MRSPANSLRPTRRQFVRGASAASVGLLAGCGQFPWRAQPAPRVPRIGHLSTTAAAPFKYGFDQRMQELGYVEGKNIIIELRIADDAPDRLPALAAELVALHVDVMVASGTAAVTSVRDATSTIPIVMGYAGDPVADGLVDSLARPGGNITGVTQFLRTLDGKRLELLKETAPWISRVGLIRDPEWNSGLQDVTASPQMVGQALGINVMLLDARGPGDLDSAFEAANHAGVQGILWGGGRNYRGLGIRSRAIALAEEHRLPAIYGFRDWVEAGGLMSYAANSQEGPRRVADFVDRILKGAKPADLPVEQPMRFEFVINLKTAQALGLTFPNSILLQATEFIQ